VGGTVLKNSASYGVFMRVRALPSTKYFILENQHSPGENPTIWRKSLISEIFAKKIF